jgi:segregation and condensation protein A
MTTDLECEQPEQLEQSDPLEHPNLIEQPKQLEASDQLNLQDHPALLEHIALVRGEAVTTLPKDLYIPPEALQVILESFEGPLDLLLYLIKRQNLDILDIPVAEITRQYVSYVELMHIMNFELAAEYLVMAAMLAEIKSRMLLPRSQEEDAENEIDPRAELVRRLQEYERFKRAAENIDNIPRMDRDFYPIAAVETGDIAPPVVFADIDLKELLAALVKVFERAKLTAHHHIEREVLSIRERMSDILHKIKRDEFTRFIDLFDCEEGRLGVVVSFIAVLELLKQSMIEIVQAEPFAPIHVRAVA